MKSHGGAYQSNQRAIKSIQADKKRLLSVEMSKLFKYRKTAAADNQIAINRTAPVLKQANGVDNYRQIRQTEKDQ